MLQEASSQERKEAAYVYSIVVVEDGSRGTGVAPHAHSHTGPAGCGCLTVLGTAGTAQEVLEGLSVSQRRREHESVSGLTLEAQHTVAASMLQICLITSGGALTMQRIGRGPVTPRC
jgi:hypothetical protein